RFVFGGGLFLRLRLSSHKSGDIRAPHRKYPPAVISRGDRSFARCQIANVEGCARKYVEGCIWPVRRTFDGPISRGTASCGRLLQCALSLLSTGSPERSRMDVRIRKPAGHVVVLPVAIPGFVSVALQDAPLSGDPTIRNFNLPYHDLGTI